MKLINVFKGVITLVVLFSFSRIHAQRIYVSKTGDDANPGTVNQPFKTIAKASAVANPGNTIVIGEGTYEETIKPSKSGTPGNPIVYTSKQGEKVIISAMQALSGWTSDGGSIWKTTVNWDLEQRNFVIRGATVLDLARWPNNTDGDRFTLNSLRNEGGSQDEVSINAFLTDGDIPNWPWSKGGSIMFYGDRSGSGWTTWRARIKNQSSGRVTFDAVKNQNWIITAHPPGDKGDYYLEGIKEALDYQNEWYFDANTNTLFVQLPGGVKPNDGEVQMAKRRVTADLENRNYIHIENLALFGGTVSIKGNGNNLKGVKVLYGSMTRGISPNFNSGINAVDIKYGSKNTIIENSEVGFGDGTGVWDSGDATIIRNNYIHDFDFLGSYDAPVMARGKNTKVLRNNISRGGRDGIQITSKNSEVAWNDISYSNLIADDCGLLYTINKGLNMDIHHNWFHDAESRGELKKAAGIYLDNDAENVRVYRNVVWNVEWTNIQINWNGKDIDIFNNTLVKADGGTMGAWHKAGTAFTNVKVWNNITDTYRTDQGGNQETEGTWEPQSDKQNNLVDQTSFINFNANNYRLNNGTLAVDAGRVISGYTNGFIGAAPDVGAYEVGDNWVPGPNWNIIQGPTGICYDLPGESCNTGVEDNVRPDANLADGVYYIQNPTNDFKINSPNGRVVNTAETTDISAQWQITKEGTYYTIKNLRNNEFLEVPYAACNKNEKAENANLNLGTYNSTSGNHQKWGITKVGEDYFLEPLHCEKVVDRNNGNGMHLWPYVAGNANQNWKIIRVEDNVRPDANLADGVYYVQNPTNDFKINSPNGRVVNTALTTDVSAQWQITKEGTYYTIKNLRNNEFLEVPYAACNKNEKAENANLNLGTYNSTSGNHQKWGITKVGEDYFLEPLHCEKVVDRNNGNGMHLWPYVAGNANQNWKIIRVEYVCSASTAISNFETTDATNTSITLAFDTLEGVNTYEVRAWPKSQFTGNINTPTAAAFKGGSSSPITIDGLTAGTEYTVVIRAICSTGGASEMIQIDTFTSGPCTVNGAITSVRKVGETNQSISIGFNEFTGSNRYELRAWPKGQFTGNINNPIATSYASGTSSPITINGLASGTEYTLVLRAICSQGVTSKLIVIDSATSSSVSRIDTTIEDQDDTIVLYPTPLKEGVLTIYLGHSKTSKVSIIDLQGNTVYHTETNEQYLKIDRTLFGHSGFYFVRVEQQGVFTTKKILVN
ncbi:RICIN domain-containing protein [Olleya sp. ITB9]|uniref:RICIN domain-containing protein n=1 Tax=Olleya sp. ITB9 TaxID=1715648 RepID=UPI0006D1C568|nr:RICIN domain-containing protein [Olleya sp. ITB9]